MRALRADEIEVRVGSVGKKGANMLLYKNARVDMAILDETYGEFGWQDKYEERKNVMYCSIGVKSPDGEWVWKEDCGTESFSEAQKGEASDAFKRAGFRWGIGRELYTAPKIQLECATEEYAKNKYKLHNPWELNGVFVSSIKTKEINGKLMIVALELSQTVWGETGVIYRWERKNYE